MASVNTVTASISTGESSPPDCGVRRAAFYFASRGQWLFAWLHLPERGPALDHGVVVCPPLGHEQIHAHRSLRHLADALARSGFPVMRFDYHGTGDSAGSDEDADRVATWRANICDAGSWLREHQGCRRISLIGVRLGAVLATQVAESAEVDGLLLWEPVVKGRAYVRQMKTLSLTATDSDRSPGESADGIEAAGFVLTEETLATLTQLDLLQCRPRCRRALIVVRDDMPADTRLLEHFEGLGIEARQTAQPGYADMMAEPHYTRVPAEAIACAVDWLRAGAQDAGRLADDRDDCPLVSVAEFPHLEIRERVLWVSRRPQLFGIVSEHAGWAVDHLPFIVMLNGGAAYRVGPNRLYVELARQLAGQGFRCLRMDLCGLGDSIAADGERENDTYTATAFRDMGLTLRRLREQEGARRIILLGLCSGAYFAFQAAAQLSDPALIESVLINPLTFYWREGMSLEVTPAQKLKSFRQGIESAWQPQKWLKLLSGRSKIGIRGAFRTLLERWQLGHPPGTARNDAALGDAAAPPNGCPSHPTREDLPADLERIARAGRRLSCFFSRADPGYDLLTIYARRKVNELCRAAALSINFIEEADHTFSRRTTRQALAQALSTHLARRYVT